MHKNERKKFRFWISIPIIIALSVQLSIAQAANRLLAWPVENKDVAQTKSKESLQPHEVRKGHVVLSSGILPKHSGAGNGKVQIIPSKGDTVSFNLFNNIAYDVKIDSVKRHGDGTVVLNGKLKDHRMRTVTMTIGSDGYLITVQDMNKAMLYRVSGNSRDGSGSVTEIDMKKMPPVIR